MGDEFIFFDEALRDRFIAYLADLGISAAHRPDRIEGFVVELPEGALGGRESRVEAEYESLMDLQRDLLDAAEGAEGQDVLGVTVTLPDGESCLVRLPAAYGRRLVEHFTFEEVHELVSIIARDVANPVSGPLCRKI